MTSSALIFGSILLAFSPSVSLLFIIILPKPQLLIVAICSAFAYLLSALASSLLWLLLTTIFPTVRSDNINGLHPWKAWLALVVPGVICQTVLRCYFVKLYFRVENVIQKSVAKHEQETSSSANDSSSNNEPNETNALQLQLNDLSCSIASGAGYGLLHSLLQYGALMASEARENYVDYGSSGGNNNSAGNEGTLFQSSCSAMPSLVNGALIAGMFSILDVIWMCCIFYGMRRRQKLYSSRRRGWMMWQSMMQGFRGAILSFWRGFDDSPSGGNAALGFVVLSHFSASLVLLLNGKENGCLFSLPLLGVVVILVTGIFLRGVKGHYLPDDQQRKIHSMSMIGGREEEKEEVQDIVGQSNGHHIE